MSAGFCGLVGLTTTVCLTRQPRSAATDALGLSLRIWDDCDAHSGEGAQIEPDWDLTAQPAPDYEVGILINR